MTEKKIILVTGGTGARGGSVAKALLTNNKFKVRILTRNPGSNAAMILQKAGAEIVRGDFNDLESLKKAMQQVYGVFVSTNFGKTFDTNRSAVQNLAESLYSSGIKHLVCSVPEHQYKQAEQTGSINPDFQEYIKDLALPATFVQTPLYYEAFLHLFPPTRGEDGNYYFGFPHGNSKLATVSVEDIGGVVASVFANSGKHIGKTIKVTGADHTPAEYAAIMSKVLKKNVYYNHIPKDVYVACGFPGAEEIAARFESHRLYISDHTADLLKSYTLNPAMQNFENWMVQNKQRFIRHFNSQFQAMII